MTGTTKEVAVSKEARVIGEVSVSKQLSECGRNVPETVRRTHADIEKIGAG